MTEKDWDAGENLSLMLEYVRTAGSERKLRLLACACCRRVWQRLQDGRSREAVNLSEAFADGLVDKASLRAACQKAYEAASPGHLGSSVEGAVQACAEEYRDYPPMTVSILQKVTPQESEDFPRLLRCIFGNPFQPVSLAPAWRTADVVRLAEVAYRERSESTGEMEANHLVVLADALEEAGCNEAAILDHLRSPGPHARGCWPVDLLLDRA